MATDLKWGMLSLLTPKEKEYDNDFFKGQVKEKAINRNFNEISEYYNLYTYFYPALESMQNLILKALKSFQKDLDNDNYTGMLCEEEDLPMLVKDRQALGLAFPNHYGRMIPTGEINDLINERMTACIEEKKIVAERKNLENKLILLTKKYNEVVGEEYKMKWTTNGQIRFYKNK